MRRLGLMVLAAAVTLQAGARADTPLSANLHQQVARRIVHEDCRLLLIGDSLSVQETFPRWPGAIMRTWAPARWVGRTTSSIYGGQLDGTYTQNLGERPRMRAVEIGFQFAYGPASNHGPKMAFEGAYEQDLAGQYVFKMPTLTHGSTRNFLGYDVGQYRGGDPFADTPMRARLIVYRDPEPFRNAAGYLLLSVRADADGRPSPTLAARDAVMTDQQQYPPGRISFVELDVPVAARPFVLPRLAVLNRDEVENFNMGEVTYGAYFYGVDAQGRPLRGFSLDSVANASWRTSQWADRTGTLVRDDLLEDYLVATRSPNTFMLFLGTNDAPFGVTPATYKANIERIITRFVEVSARPRVGVPPEQVRVLLVAPYNVPNAEGRLADYAQALYEVSENPPAGLVRGQVGFVNVYALFGGQNPMQGGRDPIHPEFTGEADPVMQAVWDPIARAARRAPRPLPPAP